jgi:hypothetical protein
VAQATVEIAGDKRVVTRSRDRNRGALEFLAGHDRTASGRVKIQTVESVINDAPVDPEVLEKHPATKLECRMREGGTAIEFKCVAGGSDPQFFFETLFALQDGERKFRDGSLRTKVAGVYKVHQWECARIESEFEFAPRNPLGATLMRGRTVAYFDLKGRRFVRAETAIAQSTRVKARVAGGAWVVRSTDLETVLRVKLNE